MDVGAGRCRRRLAHGRSTRSLVGMKTSSLFVALMVTWAPACAQSWQYDETSSSFWVKALICITARDEPWKEIGQGTLRRWRQGELTAYRLIAGGAALHWWRENRPDGESREYGDRSLSHFVTRSVDVPGKYRFGPDPMPGTWLGYDIEPQSVSSNENGEITERFGPFTIVSVIGSECPRK